MNHIELDQLREFRRWLTLQSTRKVESIRVTFQKHPTATRKMFAEYKQGGPVINNLLRRFIDQVDEEIADVEKRWSEVLKQESKSE